MKTIFNNFLVFALCITSMNIFGQNIKYANNDFNIPIDDSDDIKSVPVYYRYQIDSLNSKFQIKDANYGAFQTKFTTLASTTDEIDVTVKKLKTPYVFNNNMLNLLFANEVGKYFNGGSDLSMQRYSFSLSTEDNSLAFSYNLIDRDKSSKKSKPLRYIINLGLKAKAEGKLSTIVKDGKADNPDLGLTGKITFIGSGTINYTGKLNEIIEKRKAYQDFYQKKKEKYEKDFLTKKNDSINVIFNTVALKAAEEKKLLKSTFESFYSYINENELKVFKENKLYKNYHVYWFTFDIFIPVSEKSFIYTEAPIASNQTKPEKLYAISGSLTSTYLHKKPNNTTLFLTGQLAGKRNNNILIDEMKTIPFQTITYQSPTHQVVSSSQDVYVFENATYKEFFTTSLRGEMIYFFNKWIGVSPAIEFNMGEYYKKTNYKFGIPLSLNDKDGKPSVNFELQYRKVNSSDIFAFNASYIFGKFLK